MFLVLEIERTAEDGGTLTSTSVSFADKLSADQFFFITAAKAAKSDIPIHSVVLLNERGNLERIETFQHSVVEVTE